MQTKGGLPVAFVEFQVNRWIKVCLFRVCFLTATLFHSMLINGYVANRTSDARHTLSINCKTVCYIRRTRAVCG